MHAENKANKDDKSVETSSYKSKKWQHLWNTNKFNFLATIRQKPFAIVNAVAPDSPTKEAVSTIILFNHEFYLYSDTHYPLGFIKRG
jgi:hypothetical protein